MRFTTLFFNPSLSLQHPHEFDEKTADLINLQHYVIKEKKLIEKEAVVIFFDIVRIVESLHSVGANVILILYFEKKNISRLSFVCRSACQFLDVCHCRKTLFIET